MMPPPPPRRRPAPPPPKRAVTEPETPLISPDLEQIDIEAAIWIYGGYPQNDWPTAAKNLLAACKNTPIGYLCKAAIDHLDRNLPKTVNLESALRNQLADERNHFDGTANDEILNQPINL